MDGLAGRQLLFLSRGLRRRGSVTPSCSANVSVSNAWRRRRTTSVVEALRPVSIAMLATDHWHAWGSASLRLHAKATNSSPGRATGTYRWRHVPLTPLPSVISHSRSLFLITRHRIIGTALGDFASVIVSVEAPLQPTSPNRLARF